MKYIILDDEPIAHRIIEGFSEKLKSLEKVGNAYNAFEAIQMLQEQKVDLLFLDMNMPEINGFEFLKTLPETPQIIVTSAHKEFALEGYEFNVVDYLLKPFSFERFIKAVNKVVMVNKKILPSEYPNEHPFVYLKSGNKQIKVFFKDILFIEASGNYCKVFLQDEMIVILQKISTFEKELPKGFLRIHNSFIVAKEKVKVIEGNRLHIEHHKIPIGTTYKSRIGELYE